MNAETKKKLSAPKLMPGLVDDCPCTQRRCHRHGNCVECIRVHRTRQQHIPECLQDMFRSRVKELAALVEYDVLDLRRTPAYWDERLGKRAPVSFPQARGISGKKTVRNKLDSKTEAATRETFKEDSSWQSVKPG